MPCHIAQGLYGGFSILMKVDELDVVQVEPVHDYLTKYSGVLPGDLVRFCCFLKLQAVYKT